MRQVVGTVLTCCCCMACSEATAPCNAANVPAITLSVTNAVTGAPLTTTARVVYEHHGDDSVAVVTASTLRPIAIGTQPGSYDLRIITPGFADWLLTNVTVEGSTCTPQTRALAAYLQPVP